MRTSWILVAAGLLVITGAAYAQDTPTGLTGSADLGVRFTTVAGDAARFQRFRDVGDGVLVDRFRFDQRGDTWTFEGAADHLGWRDQRISAELRSRGKLKVSFTWDQVPLFISADTRTPYRTDAPGVLRLDDGLQQGIEAGQLRLPDVAGALTPFETRSRRDIAALRLLYSFSRDVDLKVAVRHTRREGTSPMGASFGFSNAVEIAAPIDTRTTDVDAGLEWANERGMIRVGYDGSWFDNRVPVLLWDNPLKFTDATASNAYSTGLGGSQGQAALPPSNTLQALNAATSVKLSTTTRMTTYLMVGRWRQNEALLPVTVNTAIPVTPLPRETTDAAARTVALNYTLTSRPDPHVWLSARYRYYEFENQTPVFEVPQFVILDQSVHAGEPTEPLGYVRQNFDVDASLTPVPFTAFRVGYSLSVDDRTFRIFEATQEHLYRASIDTTGGRWLVLRGLVERSERRGSGFDPELLAAVGEQADLRHYDVADRDRTRVTGLVQVMPIKALGVSVSAATGHDVYGHSGFGLRDNDNVAWSGAIEVTPTPQVALSAAYTHERFSALQNSRNASPNTPQVTDPTRNWAIDSSDRVETVTGSLDLLNALPRIDLRLAYGMTRSNAAYLYRVPADSTLVAPVQLPPVKNELHSGTGDFRFHFSPKVAVGATFWYDRYSVDNFQLGAPTFTTLTPTGSLFLGSVYRPYTARTASLRLFYAW